MRFSNSNSKRLRIVAHGVSSGRDNGAFANGFGLVSDEGFSWVESNTNGAHGSDVTGTSRTVTHGSRSGLLRTPMSGGVQSATSLHDLPRPALAVRNLMEQARFGHLCTLMSRMHHHHEGCPFGSLVDFAPDPTGHPIFSLFPLGIHTRNLLSNSKVHSPYRGIDPHHLHFEVKGWVGLSWLKDIRTDVFGESVFKLS